MAEYQVLESQVGPELRAEIRHTLRWEDVIARFACGPIKRRSSGVIVTLCVFHPEKTPSLWLRPPHPEHLPYPTFYCFGCQCEGDVLDFLLGVYDFGVEKQIREFLKTLPTLPSPDEPRLPLEE